MVLVAILAAACVAFLLGPVCSWVVTRAERRDRETWARIPGARR